MSQLTYDAELCAAVADGMVEAGAPGDPDLMLTLIGRLSAVVRDLAQQNDRLAAKLGRVQAMQLGLEAIDRRVDALEEAE